MNDNNGWISAKHLPELETSAFSKQVLCFTSLRYCKVLFYDYEFAQWTIEPHNGSVLFWQPLPEPPKN